MEKQTPHILVIDDDPNLVKTLSAILELKGFAPLTVLSGGEALAQVECRRVSVALIDLRLEDMPGLEVMRGIQARSPETECILLTGHASTSSAIDAIQLGAFSYFQKPIDIDQILLSIQRAVEKHTTATALRESEERYRTLVESSPDSIGIHCENKVVYVNAATVKLFHANCREDLIGLPVIQLVHPDYRAIAMERVRRSYEDHQPAPLLEEKFITLDGQPIDVEVTATPILHEGKAATQIIIRDITERKRAENALRESEKRYHLLFDRMLDGMYLSTHAGKFVDVNPAMVRMFGYSSKEEMLEMDIKNELYFAPEERGTHILDTGQGETDVYRLRRKDGSEIWVEDRGSYTYDEQGGIVFHEGMMRDVTERKRTEEALHASEERFHTLYDNATIGLYRTTPDGRILMLSPAGVRMLGYDSFEEIAQRDLENPEFQAGYPRKDFREKLEREGTVFGLERKMIKKDGSEILVRESAKIFRDENGETLYYDGSFEDITERKRAEESLRNSEERYHELFNSMIDGFSLHEIICDKDGKAFDYRFLEVNPAYERLTGLQATNLIGKTMLEAMPNTESYWIEIFGRVALTGLPAFYEDYSREIGRYLEVSVYCPRPGQFAVIAVDITERKLADETIRQRVMELETLNRISLVLRTASNQAEMLSIVLDEALAILNTSHGSIELHNKTTDNLEKTITRGWTAQVTVPPQNSGEGIAGRVFTSSETYITREFASDPETRAASRSQIPPNWGGICLPIRTTQQTLGVMLVSVPSERELNKDEIRLLSTLSEMTGAALQRMQLHEQTVHRLEQLKALRAVDQAISSSLDMRVTLNVLLNQTIRQLGVDAADVLMLQPGSSLLELVAGHGFHTLLLENISLSNSFAGRAILEHHPIVALDLETAALRENPRFEKLWKEEGFVCYWCVPLLVKGQVKGALEVFGRTAFTPDPEWLEFLKTLAGQAAITIDNTQLFENLQRANLDLSLAYDATIEGWSRAMDLRDHETEGHTIRVTELTMKLARAMRISEAQLTAIRRGALLHDIGKMGIPDSILLKKGKLTDEEWVWMRKHPQLAIDMLMPIAYLNNALDIPYGHHEKWDGTGYPRGLKREQIPLAARIFAVADVYDAITNDRPYHKAQMKAKALKYIREQRGAHFDPQVVEKFLELFGRKKANVSRTPAPSNTRPRGN